MHTVIYECIAAVFPYFSGKRQQRGKYIKCAELRTKKEFCNTIMRRRKIRENPRKKKSFLTRYTHEGKSVKMHRNAQ